MFVNVAPGRSRAVDCSYISCVGIEMMAPSLLQIKPQTPAIERTAKVSKSGDRRGRIVQCQNKSFYSGINPADSAGILCSSKQAGLLFADVSPGVVLQNREKG